MPVADGRIEGRQTLGQTNIRLDGRLAERIYGCYFKLSLVRLALVRLKLVKYIYFKICTVFAKCPFGELTVQPSVRYIKCLMAKCPFDQMSVNLLSVDYLSGSPSCIVLRITSESSQSH